MRFLRRYAPRNDTALFLVSSLFNYKLSPLHRHCERSEAIRCNMQVFYLYSFLLPSWSLLRSCAPRNDRALYLVSSLFNYKLPPVHRHCERSEATRCNLQVFYLHSFLLPSWSLLRRCAPRNDRALYYVLLIYKCNTKKYQY